MIERIKVRVHVPWRHLSFLTCTFFLQLETDHIVDMEQNQNALSDTEIYRRTTVLKLLLRSVHRLMQAQGTAEGLRNLVDSSLTKSLERIFRNYAKVGPAVLSFGEWLGISYKIAHPII